MLKAHRCRRCGSTKAGHTCTGGRAAAVKATKRLRDERDDTSGDERVDLCSADEDDVFVKPKKARGSSAGASSSARGSSAPVATPVATPVAESAAVGHGSGIMGALTGYVNNLEKTVADLRDDLRAETARRCAAEAAEKATVADGQVAEAARKELQGKLDAMQAEKKKARTATTSNAPAVFTELITHVDSQFAKRKAQLEADYTKAIAGPAVVGWCFRYFDEHSMWVPLPSNAAVEKQLSDLVDAVSDKVTYTVGSNTYDAEIDRSPNNTTQTEALPGELCIKQINTSHPSHTQRSLIARKGVAATRPREVVKDILYGEPVVNLGAQDIDQLLANLDANEPLATVASADLASLATKWSAFASGHNYQPDKTLIWSNALLLRQWLSLAKARSLSRARIVMHGSQHYEQMRTDPMCYDMKHSHTGCARGPGLYVSVADHIPRDYNGSAPIGTGILGLLLCGDDVNEGIESQAGSSRTIGTGNNVHIYTRYKLNATNTPSEIRNDQTCKDAIRILELSRFLPLGLAHT